MSIESLKQQARKHEQSEDWQKALAQYNKALAALERDEQVDIGLFNRVGDLYVRVGSLEEAVEHYEKAVELYREAYLPNNAIAVCKKIIRNVPRHHRAYLVIGQIRAEQGFLPDARTNFLTYAERMQQDGDLDESFRALIEFCDLSPEDVGIRMTVAEQMAAQGRDDEAVQQLLIAHGHFAQLGKTSQADEVEQKIRAIAPDADLSAASTAGAFGGSGDSGDFGGQFGEISLGSDAFMSSDDEEDAGSSVAGAMEEEAAADTGSGEAEDDLGGGFDVTEDDLSEEEATELPVMGFDDDEEPTELPMIGFDDDDEEPTELPMMGFDDDDEEATELPMIGFDDDEENEAADLPMTDVETDDGGVAGLTEDTVDAGEITIEPTFGASEAMEEAVEETAGDEAPSSPELDITAPAETSRPPVEPAPPPAEPASPVESAPPSVESDPPPEPEAPPAAEPARSGGAEGGYVDLGAMILGGGGGGEKSTRFTVAYEEPSGDEQADFAKMLSQFKEKVSENLDTGDVRAHYDLGTAYKEMGLLDEAITSFQAALRASADHLPTYEMMGQTFIEMGQPEAAVRSLERAVKTADTVEDELVGIYYYLGRAYEALANKESAVDFYDRVFALDINFADVTERLRELR